MPSFSICAARLMAVCPPNCTMAKSGFSAAATPVTSSGVSGSKYRRSAVSKSVDTVSGLLLMITVSQPSFCSAQTACTEQ